MILLCLALPAGAWAEESTEPTEAEEPVPSRPLHLVAQAGVYGALGSPAPWGRTLSLDLLPGHFAGRYGIRGEWRGYRSDNEGSFLVGALFEAGASRPQLALKLVAEAGMTHNKKPIIGAGIEWSLWLLGPVGISILSDLQIVIDGKGTRPALTGTLSLHIGR